jgi:hypothetical protein
VVDIAMLPSLARRDEVRVAGSCAAFADAARRLERN